MKRFFDFWPVCLGIGFLALAGCSDRSQEMEERVTQLQRDLDRLQAQLNTANLKLAKQDGGTSTPTEPIAASANTTTGWMGQDALQDTFHAADAAMRKDMEENLKGYRVVNCLMQTTPAPADPYPYKSQINLSLVSDQGKSIILSDVPVKADLEGNWIFPTAAEVSQQIATRENPRPATNNVAAANSGPHQSAAQPATAAPPEAAAPAMAADKTVTFHWGDERPRAAAPRAPETDPRTASAPAPAPVAPPQAAPPATATPAPPMPADRTVRIHF